MGHVPQSRVVYHRSPRISQRSLGAGQHSWSVGAVPIRWIPIIVFILLHQRVCHTAGGTYARAHDEMSYRIQMQILFNGAVFEIRPVLAKLQWNSHEPGRIPLLCNQFWSLPLFWSFIGNRWLSISLFIGVCRTPRSGGGDIIRRCASAQCDITVMPVGGV